MSSAIEHSFIVGGQQFTVLGYIQSSTFSFALAFELLEIVFRSSPFVLPRTLDQRGISFHWNARRQNQMPDIMFGGKKDEKQIQIVLIGISAGNVTSLNFELADV